MSVIRFTDVGLRCNYTGCTTMRYGSQIGLGNGMTLSHVRKTLREHGWQTGVEPADDDGPDDGKPRLDYCPQHKDKVSWAGLHPTAR